MADTPQMNFRFSRATLDLIERLADSYGGMSKADVIRIAVAELARTRLGPTPKKNPKKSPSAS